MCGYGMVWVGGMRCLSVQEFPDEASNPAAPPPSQYKDQHNKEDNHSKVFKNKAEMFPKHHTDCNHTGMFLVQWCN